MSEIPTRPEASKPRIVTVWFAKDGTVYDAKAGDDSEIFALMERVVYREILPGEEQRIKALESLIQRIGQEPCSEQVYQWLKNTRILDERQALFPDVSLALNPSLPKGEPSVIPGEVAVPVGFPKVPETPGFRQIVRGFGWNNDRKSTHYLSASSWSDNWLESENRIPDGDKERFYIELIPTSPELVVNETPVREPQAELRRVDEPQATAAGKFIGELRDKESEQRKQFDAASRGATYPPPESEWPVKLDPGVGMVWEVQPFRKGTFKQHHRHIIMKQGGWSEYNPNSGDIGFDREVVFRAIPAPLQLEVGESYLNRKGEVVGPIHKLHGDEDFQWRDTSGRYFLDNGNCQKGGQCDYDLIAPAPVQEDAQEIVGGPEIPGDRSCGDCYNGTLIESGETCERCKRHRPANEDPEATIVTANLTPQKLRAAHAPEDPEMQAARDALPQGFLGPVRGPLKDQSDQISDDIIAWGSAQKVWRDQGYYGNSDELYAIRANTPLAVANGLEVAKEEDGLWGGEPYEENGVWWRNLGPKAVIEAGDYVNSGEWELALMAVGCRVGDDYQARRRVEAKPVQPLEFDMWLYRDKHLQHECNEPNPETAANIGWRQVKVQVIERVRDGREG